jgi:lipoprotein-releasing system permease protein
MPFSLYLALKYLRPKRTFVSVVTVISIIGVLLGVAILIIVLSVMEGFDGMWREKILSFKPHLTVVSQHGYIQNENEVCRKVEEIKGVTGAAPCIMTQVLMKQGNSTSAPIVIGIDPEWAGKVTKVPENIIAGRFDLYEGIVTGIDEFASMGLQIGSEVLLYSQVNMQAIFNDEMHMPEELQVKGVFNMGMQKFDSGIVLTSLDTARDLVGLDSGAYMIYVMTDDAFKFHEYACRVQQHLGYAYNVRTWKDEDKVLFDALKVEKTMMSILLAFITVVAIFCVTNTLIVITVQKTNEIGLLKALGFSEGQITIAFVFHGWIQCLTGIVLGITAGLLILHNLDNIVDLLRAMGLQVFPKSIYGFNTIPRETSLQDVLKVSGSVMFFCTLASVFPAWRAASMDPVEAFRHE